MRTGKPIFVIVLITIIPALVFLTACDDDSPTSPKGSTVIGPVASSPESLLAVVLENAYNSRDSTAYAAMLDSLYEFELLPDDPEDTLHVETWDWANELRIAGRMFSGWENPDGVKVLSIYLDCRFLDKVVASGDFQDQPEGETWYRARTEVDLVVITKDPSASDGSGIVVRMLFSPQKFIVRPDPDKPGLWVIREQSDQLPITKRGTGQVSWGAIKSLFQ